jgi:DNA-binding MarR family transcriptional regulator
LCGEEPEPVSASEGRHESLRAKTAFEQLKALLSPKNKRPRLELTEDHIHSILIARRGREAVFGVNLFSDPSWDTLLELYAAKLGDRRVSLAELSRAINTPTSIARRWIAVLETRGLVASRHDAVQPDRQWIALTEDGASKIKQLTDHWGEAFLSI